jgi:hypothetical protein
MQVAAIAFILMPAAAGVVAVHASATCERFVRTYVTKPVRNRLSKTTAEAWAEWRIGHPNWKPNPSIHRPKYIMTREEALQKVAFACEVPLEPVSLDMFFTAADFELPPPIVNFPPMEATQINFPDEIPPEVAEIPPSESWPPLGPFVPPALGGQPINGSPIVPAVPSGPPPYTGPVPEPGSLVLLSTGFGFLCLLLAARAAREDARLDAEMIEPSAIVLQIPKES